MKPVNTPRAKARGVFFEKRKLIFEFAYCVVEKFFKKNRKGLAYLHLIKVSENCPRNRLKTQPSPTPAPIPIQSLRNGP
jgi:catabolite regulation protein CreA